MNFFIIFALNSHSNRKDEQSQTNMVHNYGESHKPEIAYFLTKSVHPSGVNRSWGRNRDLYSILAEPLTQ